MLQPVPALRTVQAIVLQPVKKSTTRKCRHLPFFAVFVKAFRSRFSARSLYCLSWLGRLCPVLYFDFKFFAPPNSRNFTDAWIAGENEIAGVKSRFFKIRRIGWQNLPARNFLSQYPDRSHVWKLGPKALVMFFRSRQPDSVVGAVCRLLAQYEYDLLLDIHSRTAKHGASHG